MKQEPCFDLFFNNNPTVLEISRLDLQDYRGSEIDSFRISKPTLKMDYLFFGLEFEDVMYGTSVTQFYSSDIISIVRQADRSSISFHFSRPLKLKSNKSHSLQDAMYMVRFL